MTRVAAARSAQKPLQPGLALGQWQWAQIVVALEQQIEGEEDEIVGLLLGQGRLQRGEIGRAVVVERHDLAIDDAVRRDAAAFGDRGKFRGPVESLAGLRA